MEIIVEPAILASSLPNSVDVVSLSDDSSSDTTT
jgi:hypothetical protein